MSKTSFSRIHSFPGQSIVHKLVPEYFRPKGYFARLTRKRTKSRVYSGPFKGMHYIETSFGSAYVPKLIGIYERELIPQVEEICTQHPSLIVDVGAAEGYYAVGLALRNPKAHVVAFEMQEQGRQLLAEMAQLNHVADRLEIRGKGEPDDLQSVLSGKSDPVVICDVEGYEEILLDLAVVPALKSASILVETHDGIRPGITDLLQTRFAPTHKVNRTWQERRSSSEYPWRTLGTALLPSLYLDLAIDEWRPTQTSWLWMQPKT